MVTVGLFGNLALAQQSVQTVQIRPSRSPPGSVAKLDLRCSRAIIFDLPRCQLSWAWHLELEKEVHEDLIPLRSRRSFDKQGQSSQGDWPFPFGAESFNWTTSGDPAAEENVCSS